MSAGTARRAFALDNPLARRMAEGHRIRKGHALAGFYTDDADGFRVFTRTCCGGYLV